MLFHQTRFYAGNYALFPSTLSIDCRGGANNLCPKQGSGTVGVFVSLQKINWATTIDLSCVSCTINALLQVYSVYTSSTNYSTLTAHAA